MSSIAHQPTVVAYTPLVPTDGVYFIDASAILYEDSDDNGVYCYAAPSSDPGLHSYDFLGGGDVSGHFQQASTTDVWSINAGDSLELLCYSNSGDLNSYTYDAEINAVLINSVDQSAKRKGHAALPLTPKHP